MNKESIKEKIRAQLPMLREKYHVKQLGIFGSAARGDDGPESDIDILVELESPIGFFDFIRLERFLSGILQRKVDLVSRRAIKPAIREDVLNETTYV